MKNLVILSYLFACFLAVGCTNNKPVPMPTVIGDIQNAKMPKVDSIKVSKFGHQAELIGRTLKVNGGIVSLPKLAEFYLAKSKQSDLSLEFSRDEEPSSLIVRIRSFYPSAKECEEFARNTSVRDRGVCRRVLLDDEGQSIREAELVVPLNKRPIIPIIRTRDWRMKGVIKEGGYEVTLEDMRLVVEHGAVTTGLRLPKSVSDLFSKSRDVNIPTRLSFVKFDKNQSVLLLELGS